MPDFTKSQDSTTTIAITGEKSRTFIKIMASDAWLKDRKVSHRHEARAVMVEHAYKLPMLKDMVGSGKSAHGRCISVSPTSTGRSRW
ncbi:hypothetical protein [Jannaschia helgolandensis]|uniref:hypothetical protein n=1 Tax=Jannaschia helgolandensis TaxID=188906 RepID=UPI0030DC84B4|tara:strand:+ start:385 stop:645 length:261 start_codon:yes stop_codon:yes gene_type:complete